MKLFIGLISVFMVFGMFVVASQAQIAASASTSIGFKKPEGWFESDQKARDQNIKKFDFFDEQLNSMFEREKSGRVLAVFLKHDPQRVEGIIPTIQVILRPKGKMTFEQFSKSLAASITPEQLPNYKIIGEPKAQDVAAIVSVLFDSTFDLQYGDEVFGIRTRMYAIPRSTYFYQITMSDKDGDKWPEKEFTEFINSVKIVK